MERTLPTTDSDPVRHRVTHAVHIYEIHRQSIGLQVDAVYPVRCQIDDDCCCNDRSLEGHLDVSFQGHSI